MEGHGPVAAVAGDDGNAGDVHKCCCHSASFFNRYHPSAARLRLLAIASPVDGRIRVEWGWYCCRRGKKVPRKRQNRETLLQI
jgi:hypothetical protein